MFVWFLGLSPLLVWVVFSSPALDLRVVMLGSVLPLVEIVFGGPRVLHTLLGAVVALVVVMLATRSHRMRRRRLLCLPIGLFLHLVLDGVWTSTQVFWWPFAGTSFGSGNLPEVERGAWSLAMEVVGAGALYFAYRRFGLDDPERRATFLHSGRVAEVEPRGR